MKESQYQYHVDTEFYEKVKTAAWKSRTSVKQYITDALKEKMEKDNFTE